MATLAPSRAKTVAISLPMPLAAPVTMATLSFMRMALPPPIWIGMNAIAETQYTLRALVSSRAC
jgi:hypothetical protein